MPRAVVPEWAGVMGSGHKRRTIFERYDIVNDADFKLAARNQEIYLNAQRVGNGYKTVTIENPKKRKPSLRL